MSLSDECLAAPYKTAVERSVSCMGHSVCLQIAYLGKLPHAAAIRTKQHFVCCALSFEHFVVSFSNG